jgi:pyrimidine operon attenuation protein/uracil phosphoribosyltransferase
MPRRAARASPDAVTSVGAPRRVQLAVVALHRVFAEDFGE